MNKKRMRIMEELPLPELQARFHDIVGEATRSPNKKFLLRRIAEALEAQEQEAAEAANAVEATEPEATEPEAATANGEPKLTKLSVEELQALYTEVVGRDTGSSDRRYPIDFDALDVQSLRELVRLIRDLEHEKQAAVNQARMMPWRR